MFGGEDVCLSGATGVDAAGDGCSGVAVDLGEVCGGLMIDRVCAAASAEAASPLGTLNLIFMPNCPEVDSVVSLCFACDEAKSQLGEE